MRKYSIYAAIAAIGLPVATFAADPTVQELQDQIKALQGKVEQLEQKQVQQQQVSQAQVTATVDAVMRDAVKRSEAFGGASFTAGWNDGKFLLQSADGNYVLHPYFQFQLRNTTTMREDGKNGDNDDTQNGFEIRRMKFGFDGNVITKDLTYAFQWAVDRKNGSVSLEDAWVKYKFNPAFAIRGGQFKDTFSHESIVSSKKFMAAERTYMNDMFSPGDNFVQGVTLLYDRKGPLHVDVTFHDGATIGPPNNKNNSNQNFQDFGTNNGDYGGAVRVEYLVMGDWKNYEDYSALGTKDMLLVLGAGMDYTEAGDTGVLLYTVDAQFEMPNGLSFAGAFMGRNTDNNPVESGVVAPALPTPTQDLNDWGFFLQAAYLFNSKWEIFGRYGYTNFDSGGVPAGFDNNVSEITGGVNYYMKGHNAKMTFDIGYLPDGAPFNDDGAGILTNKDSEFYMRAQFQLLL